MNSTKNKLKGMKNKTIGAIKEKIGKSIGNSKLEAKGSAERTKGQIQSAFGNMQSAAKAKLKKMEDASRRA